MDKYSEMLINAASHMDAASNGHGTAAQLALQIVHDDNSKSATIGLLHEISAITNRTPCPKEVTRAAQMVNAALIDYYGYQTLHTMCSSDTDSDCSSEKTLDELLAELDSLIGLEKVKAKVNDLIIYQKVQKLRNGMGLHSAKGTMHLAFTGNPGTGKTTVARIVGRIYHKIGLLSTGHFIEVSRTDLIAGYQGQTALKVKKVIEKAKGGVLFIDEAYSITENDHSDSYGRECLTELTKALEDYRDDLVVIVAGYTEPMNKFFKSNPGLKSRFNTFIEFEDYSSKELEDILESMCRSNDYRLSDTAKEKISRYLSDMTMQKDDNFANARMVRNLYDDLIMNHAHRVIKIENPTKEDLSFIQAEDFSYNGSAHWIDSGSDDSGSPSPADTD